MVGEIKTMLVYIPSKSLFLYPMHVCVLCQGLLEKKSIVIYFFLIANPSPI